MDGLNYSQIFEKSTSVKEPNWIKSHEHLWGIPDTKSFVFYPHNINETYENDLNSEYNLYGYTVVLMPRIDSEYNQRVGSALKGTYKVLILEPDYNPEKIDRGCCLLRKMFNLYFIRKGVDLDKPE